jgi:hypothetical protein
LLATDLTYRETGTELYLSLNTVRTHAGACVASWEPRRGTKPSPARELSLP